MLLYHGTLARNVESIMSKGITPRTDDCGNYETLPTTRITNYELLSSGNRRVISRRMRTSVLARQLENGRGVFMLRNF